MSPSAVSMTAPSKRRARKQSLAARVAQDLRVQLEVGRGAGFAPDRAGRDRDISAQLDVVLQQAASAVRRHEQHDVVSRLDADLEAEAGAADVQKGRRAPAAGRAADDESAAAATADAERGLDDLREDRHAVRLVENALGNRLVGRAHDLPKDLSRLGGLLDFVVGVLGRRLAERDRMQHRAPGTATDLCTSSSYSHASEAREVQD